MKVIHCQCGLVGLCFLWAMAVRTCAAENISPVLISEFMADNQHGLKDEDGEHSGWIEIHNTSGTPINLTGWSLTVDRANLTEWRFPRVSLLAEKYLIVFASGKDRALDPNHLHTNFRLDPHGGYLALVNRNTNLVSEFKNYPEQGVDISYGRAPGEPAVTGRFQHPTPGKANGTHGPGFAPEVVFSRGSGTFAGPMSIELSCGNTNAVVRYTTNGSLPNGRSPIYQGPVSVAKTTHLRARAYQDGLLPGPPHSETFVLLHPTLQPFTSNLPVLVMDTLGQDLPNSEVNSFAQLTLFEPVNGRTSLTNAPSLTTRAGFHVRGSSSMNMPQESFVVHFLNEFNEEQHQPILGMPADSDWVLYGPNRYEPVMIHNPFVHQLSRDMGRYSPRTRFIEVYLVKNSGPVSLRQYQGVYVLEEKIKVGKHRVDIDRLGPADLKGAEVTGGYLMKIDRLGPNEGGFWAGDASFVYVEPKERVIELPERAPQKQYLAKYFSDFERALRGPNWKDPLLGYRAYIDVDAWIDYHVLEVLSGNVDALFFSTYFYKPRNGKLVFGPHWDFDRALGSTDGRDDNPRHWNTGRFFGGAWWWQLFRDPDFWQLWVDRWQELRQDQFSGTHLNGLIDRLSDELREAQPRQLAKWDLQPRGGTYQSEIDWMKEWLSNRVDFIDDQLTAKPAIALSAGAEANQSTVTLAVPNNATVYYTLDGTDPRLPQGALSTAAHPYSGPILLQSGARLIARARDPAKRQIGGPRLSTPWSGPVSVTAKSNPARN